MFLKGSGSHLQSQNVITQIVNTAYTLNSSLIFYLLLENFTTFNYKISYTSS